MAPLIRVENLHFTYNAGTDQAVPALKGIDLDIHAGEYVVIVGHNGSGKSTLARHLNALLLPTQGRVYVDGMDTREPAYTIPIRSRVGMVFQEPDNQIVGSIVEEDVAFGPENLGVPREELVGRVRHALELVGMWPYRHRAPHLLSGGQKQRVAIAGVLAMQPACLVLDEATSMLDPAGRAEVLEIVRRLHQQGITIVAITHFMEEALEADRVLVMSQGQIVLSGSPSEVFAARHRLHELRLRLPAVARLAEALRARRPALPEHLFTVPALVEAIDHLARREAHHARICAPRDTAETRASPCTGFEGASSRSIGDPLVAIRDLHYTYLAGTPMETVALRGASLTVQPGEIVSLIGPTGAGKSTLLQHCNGLLRPTQRDTVLVDGRDLADLTVDVRRLRQTVGLVFQHPERQVFEHFVGDDIAYGPKQLGLSRPEVRERVQWAMQAVGLDFDTFVDRPTSALSGGERRKVALAGILALRPRVLALDESTTGLDPLTRQEVLDLLQRMNKEEGTTIIFVSSEIEEVAALAQQVDILVDGRTVMEGSTPEVLTRGAELRMWGLDQPATCAVLQGLRARGYEVDPTKIQVEQAVEEICKILPS